MVQRLALATGPIVLRALHNAPIIVVLWTRVAIGAKVAYNDATELAWGAEQAPDEIHGVCQLLEFNIAKLPVQTRNLVNELPAPNVALVECLAVGPPQQWIFLHLADYLPVAFRTNALHWPTTHLLAMESLILALLALFKCPFVVLQCSNPFLTV